jgi:hypothetical protein
LQALTTASSSRTRVCRARPTGERRQERGIETFFGREIGGELAAGEKLPVLQIVGGGVIRREPSRYPRQSITFERGHVAGERLLLDDALDLGPRLGDVLADAQQLRRLRRIHAAAHPHPGRRDLEVETCAFMPRETAARKDRGGVRLERCFVGAEARVAVDAIEGRFRRRHEIGRHPLEVAGELFDHREQRLPYVRLVVVFSRLEPLAIVIAFQRAQELQRVIREPGGHRDHDTGSTCTEEASLLQ